MWFWASCFTSIGLNILINKIRDVEKMIFKLSSIFFEFLSYSPVHQASVIYYWLQKNKNFFSLELKAKKGLEKFSILFFTKILISMFL